VSGHLIQGVVAPFAPWVLRTNSSGTLEYGGASFDFFQEVLAMFEPPGRLQ
ncbi:unnamed protein product, partial [Symbiodinium pilosum]